MIYYRAFNSKASKQKKNWNFHRGSDKVHWHNSNDNKQRNDDNNNVNFVSSRLMFSSSSSSLFFLFRSFCVEKRQFGARNKCTHTRARSLACSAKKWLINKNEDDLMLIVNEINDGTGPLFRWESRTVCRRAIGLFETSTALRVYVALFLAVITNVKRERTGWMDTKKPVENVGAKETLALQRFPLPKQRRNRQKKRKTEIKYYDTMRLLNQRWYQRFHFVHKNVTTCFGCFWPYILCVWHLIFEFVLLGFLGVCARFV